MATNDRVFLLTCPHCGERGELPTDLEGVPALECPKCNGHIGLSANLSQSVPSPSRQKGPEAVTSGKQSEHDSSLPHPPTVKGSRETLLADTLVFLKSPDVLRVCAFLAILCGIGLGLHFAGFFSFLGTTPDPVERYARGIVIPETVTEEPVIAKDVGNRLLTGAFAVFSQFHRAKSPEEKLKWVLRSEDVRDKLFDYYSAKPDQKFAESPLKGYSAPERMGVDDIRRGIVALVKEVPHESNPDAKRLEMIAFFRQTHDGIKLDWESYVQAQDGLLRKFLQNDSSAPGIFRVRLTRSHYFGKAQPAHTICVQLDDLVSLPKQPFVFIPENSELALEIKEHLPWSANILKSTRYATVQLSWKSSLRSPGKRNLVIDELLCWELLGVGSEATPPEA